MHETPEPGSAAADAPWKTNWHERLARQIPRVTAVGAAVAGILVAGWVLIGDLKPDEAVVGTLVGLVALVLLVAAFASAEWLAAMLGRVKGVKVGGFEIQLDAFQKVADESSASQSDDEPGSARNLTDLKINLENKIAYVANNIINSDKSSDPMPGFVTIGSLKKGEGLLKREQAQVAYEIMGMQQHDFALLTPQDREVFFNGASALVSSMRITVFASLVNKRLARPGWKVQLMPGELRDITLRSTFSEGSLVHHIIPVVASKKATFVYERAEDLLERSPRSTGNRGRRFIVVPPLFEEKQDSLLRSTDASDEIADRIWTVTLFALLQWLRSEEAAHASEQ